MTPIEEQLGQLRSRFPKADLVPAPGSLGVVIIPEFKIPPGWNQTTTTVKFVVPTGYPLSALDCFWASPDLRLASGNVPQSAQIQSPAPALPDGAPHLWFSWHVPAWTPGRDTLLTYARVIYDRFKELR
jgi:hypothetical protein